MSRSLGFSVFVSRFEETKARLRGLYAPGGRIFTSLHIAEEFDGTYVRRAEAMCAELNAMGYGIVADVSRRSLEVFGESDLAALARRLGVETLRIDYGFGDDEVERLARLMPVCINASTATEAFAARIARAAVRASAMHNYYPRPETGLDRSFFDGANRRLSALGIEVFSFVPGAAPLRGPLGRGLPTLEDHRDAAPYAAFVDTVVSHGVEGVFVGDGLPGEADAAFARDWAETGVPGLPVAFDPRCAGLEGRTFTVRPDSPARAMRLQESREYATQGGDVEPCNTVERSAGSVTMDNRGYLRYSGEIQILREVLPADPKVNVVGTVPEAYRLLLKNLPNGGKLKFLRSPIQP